jgi:hypothetical protein
MTFRALARAAAPCLALLTACAHGRGAPASGLPAGWTSQAFVVQGGGRLVLGLPPGWTATEGEEGEASVPAIKLRMPGARFLALLSPLRNPGEPESPAARADTAQLFAELGRRKALGGSVETEIPLEALSGPGGVRGAYFSATDRDLVGRDPGEDEFRHVLQGAAAVGPVILAFTLLDDGPGPWRDQVLELVRTARHVADGAADDGEADLEPMSGVETVPLRVALPGKSWALLVDLPGFDVARVAPGRVPPGGVHLLARSAETELVASVLLLPARDAKDAPACRERALGRIRAGVKGVQNVRLTEGGGTAAVTYAVGAGPGGTPEWHAHAFLWRDGVCASVHVSKAAPGPDDAARLDAVLSSLRVAEDL